MAITERIRELLPTDSGRESPYGFRMLSYFQAQGSRFLVHICLMLSSISAEMKNIHKYMKNSDSRIYSSLDALW